MRTTYVYRNEFWDFYYAQKQEVQDKIDWIIGLVRTLRMVPDKFFKHIEGLTDFLKSKPGLALILFGFSASSTKVI